MLEINDLSVSLGGAEVLHEINLSIDGNSDIVGLFGPNGAGKTTLLNTLTGTINRYKGKVFFGPNDTISFLPDKPFLYGFLTLEGAIEYYSAAYRDFDRNKAAVLFDRLGLSLKQRISKCSKGMSEQIHLILAICRNVNMYLLDEPLAGVDPLTRDAIIDILVNYRSEGSAVIISTHLISDVEELFDKVIMIKAGRILLFDTVESLKGPSGKDLETIFKERLR